MEDYINKKYFLSRLKSYPLYWWNFHFTRNPPSNPTPTLPFSGFLYMKAYEHKWVNPILNIIGVNPLLNFIIFSLGQLPLSFNPHASPLRITLSCSISPHALRPLHKSFLFPREKLEERIIYIKKQQRKY